LRRVTKQTTLDNEAEENVEQGVFRRKLVTVYAPGDRFTLHCVIVAGGLVQVVLLLQIIFVLISLL